MAFDTTMRIAASGMAAQNARIRVIAQNIANADSVADRPDADPYRRQTIAFRNVLDRERGVRLVEVAGIRPDRSDFGRRHAPDHPAADAAGYIRTPNVNGLIEMADLRQAQHSYAANLRVIEAARGMVSRTIELLR